MTLESDSSKDVCACLNWVEVYYKGAAKCGDTFELNPAFPYYKKHWPEATNDEVRFLASAEWHSVYCDDMFMKLDNRLCVNGDHGHGAALKDWCYVKAECRDLNGGSTINATKYVNWKACKPGVDELMRDLPLENVLARANAKKLNLPIFLPNVYKSAAYGAYMTDARALTSAGGAQPDARLDGLPRSPLSALAEQELSKAHIAGEPIWFWRAEDHESPNFLVTGVTAYRVELDEVKCIAGCMDMKM